jgi:hypothetical protein
VTITNNGPSNIAKLYLATDTDVAPDYLVTDRGTCSDPGAPLACSFGALRKGQTVTVVAAFPTTADETSFTAGFYASSNGATGSDKGHNSHGDYLRPTVPEQPVQVTDDPDFGGGFVVGDAPVVSTSDNLTPANPQSTKVAPPVSNIVATVDDGADVNDPDNPAYTCPTGHTCFGLWSKVTVGHGQTFPKAGGGNYLFPVTLTVLATQVPAPSFLSIKAVHVTDTGDAVTLNRCADPLHPTLNCITVQAVAGGKYVITAYVDQNGGFKGML